MNILIGILAILGAFAAGIIAGAMITIQYIRNRPGGIEFLERMLGR